MEVFLPKGMLHGGGVNANYNYNCCLIRDRSILVHMVANGLMADAYPLCLWFPHKLIDPAISHCMLGDRLRQFNVDMVGPFDRTPISILCHTFTVLEGLIYSILSQYWSLSARASHEIMNTMTILFSVHEKTLRNSKLQTHLQNWYERACWLSHLYLKFLESSIWM